MVAVGYGLQTADCEDVVQETFMRLLRADPTFNDSEHEKAWLIVTAANVCKNYLTKSERKNLALQDWDADGETPSSEVPPAPDQDSQLLACLGQLPERLRLTLYLYYYEGYNSQEISEMLGIHPASVRRRLSEARSLIKKLWKQYEK